MDQLMFWLLHILAECVQCIKKSTAFITLYQFGYLEYNIVRRG